MVGGKSFYSGLAHLGCDARWLEEQREMQEKTFMHILMPPRAGDRLTDSDRTRQGRSLPPTKPRRADFILFSTILFLVQTTVLLGAVGARRFRPRSK